MKYCILTYCARVHNAHIFNAPTTWETYSITIVHTFARKKSVCSTDESDLPMCSRQINLPFFFSSLREILRMKELLKLRLAKMIAVKWPTSIVCPMIVHSLYFSLMNINFACRQHKSQVLRLLNKKQPHVVASKTYCVSSSCRPWH